MENGYRAAKATARTAAKAPTPLRHESTTFPFTCGQFGRVHIISTIPVWVGCILWEINVFDFNTKAIAHIDPAFESLLRIAPTD